MASKKVTQMNLYVVTIPIRGNIEIEVEAEDRDAAIEKAVEECTLGDVEDWNTIASQAEVECSDDDDDT
jgi:hypothetical protein